MGRVKAGDRVVKEESQGARSRLGGRERPGGLKTLTAGQDLGEDTRGEI